MELILPCPSCGWQDIMRRSVSFEISVNGVSSRSNDIKIGGRCLKCHWEGSFVFPVIVQTTREGLSERD